MPQLEVFSNGLSRDERLAHFIRSIGAQRNASIETELEAYLIVYPSHKKGIHMEHAVSDGSITIFHDRDRILYYPPARVEGDSVVFEFQRIWDA